MGYSHMGNVPSLKISIILLIGFLMKGVTEMASEILIEKISLPPREKCDEFEFGLISPLHDLENTYVPSSLIIVVNDVIVFKSNSTLKRFDYVVYLREDNFYTEIIVSGGNTKITNKLLSKIKATVNERIQKHLLSEFDKHKIDNLILLLDKQDVFRDKNLSYLF